ncbi:MAG TPA: anhydro-N-acetylmuramic acid kinase [Acetobacteraceae bacterium]|nr:anhydro-N-acetylmuramic acid kinase [Acetobacteraceae bacterium]
MLRTVGLMSGTSLDGVDAAWVETDGERVGRIGPALTLPYDDALRAELRRLLDLAPDIAPDDPAITDAERRLTEMHRAAVAAIGEPADLIGMHGQTILHAPERRRTWQIGDAAWLAAETGLPVAWDFRSADVAAGGEGAPLVPLFHAALAAGMERPLAVLNIGGVANLTFLGRDGGLSACDTGPGNAALDDWAHRRTGEPMDRDGALAAAGVADEALLGRWLAHPFFARLGPKSLDRLDFARVLDGVNHLSAADGAATLAHFTAAAVAATRLPEPPRRWLVCGGGRRNPAIMAALRARLGAPVDPVDAVGWNGDALEAQCFGFLAARVAAGLPLSLPETTGVPRPMPGGRIARPA